MPRSRAPVTPRQFDPRPKPVKRPKGKATDPRLPPAPPGAPHGRWAVRVPNWHPARLNQFANQHWSARKRHKDADAAMAYAYCVKAGVTAAVLKRVVTLTIVLGPRQRGGDVDAYWKSLLDALVRCGALVDDSDKWAMTVGPRYERGPERATVIELADADDAA